jgi:hypothetical protein
VNLSIFLLSRLSFTPSGESATAAVNASSCRRWSRRGQVGGGRGDVERTPRRLLPQNHVQTIPTSKKVKNHSFNEAGKYMCFYTGFWRNVKNCWQRASSRALFRAGDGNHVRTQCGRELEPLTLPHARGREPEPFGKFSPEPWGRMSPASRTYFVGRSH